MIYILAVSNAVTIILFFLSLFHKMNKIVIDIFPLFFLCIQTVGILTLDLKTGKNTEEGFCNQIGAYYLLISLVTLIFLRVNWFIIWIASLIIFGATIVIFAVSLKKNLFQKREDIIILILNLAVFVVSYCIEYLQLKYWLQKKMFDKERKGFMHVIN